MDQELIPFLAIQSAPGKACHSSYAVLCRLILLGLVIANPVASAQTLRFSMGSAPSAATAPILPTTFYRSETGFGWERGAALVAHDHCLTSERPFFFSVNLPEGNHRVRVILGSETGDSTVCDQPLEPWNSWGQMLPRFFQPQGVSMGRRLAEVSPALTGAAFYTSCPGGSKTIKC